MQDEISVREIIALTGGTSPYIHGLLVEAGVPMRSHGGSKPGRTLRTTRHRDPGGAR